MRSSIKDAIVKIRQKVEEFKDDHPGASKAISKVIDNVLPEPLKTLCGIFWEGIEKEDKSIEKIIQLLERFEREVESNEKLLTEIEKKISVILKNGALRQEIQQIADQMRTSNQSILNTLISNTEIQIQIRNDVAKIRKQTASDEVTYSIVEFGGMNVHPILENVASAINTEANGNGKSNFSRIPFIPFDDFYDLKDKTKVFLYGKSGCGKSRGIIELLRDKINNVQNGKVYTINPQDSRENSLRISISELVDNLRKNDIVIWDNFPDDLKHAY